MIVSERVDEPLSASGLRSTPRTSTSSGSPEASSASLDASSLALSCLASLAASFLASFLASSLACLDSYLRADRSSVSGGGFWLRAAARSFVVLWAGALVSSAGPPPLASTKAAACVPIPKNRHARIATATSRRRRYCARLSRPRLESDRFLVFFKAPRRYPCIAGKCC